VALEQHKQAEIDSRTAEFMAGSRPQPGGRVGRVPPGGDETKKPFGHDPVSFTDWATIATMFDSLEVPAGARVIDVGCGGGWTSLFLAETGYRVVGYDIVPFNVDVARARAERWGVDASFETADMESLPAGDPVDVALVFDALHHSTRQLAVLQSVAGRLRSGGWVLLGEPGWIHRFSPGAHATRRDLGWTERGLTVRGLRRDLRAAGFGDVRRFFQPTRPYESRVRGFAWQLVRLAAANVWVAPGAHLWLAARRD
jgi:SAM-dependent methyltransferase